MGLGVAVSVRVSSWMSSGGIFNPNWAAALGLNLVTFTAYKGIDPERVNMGVIGNENFTFSPGIDHRDKYPTTRTYTLGLNLTF